MKYVVYCIILEHYKGTNISHSKLLKVGYSRDSAKYRLDVNERLEGDLSYRALFGKITIAAEKEFGSQQEALLYEEKLLTALGRKDCSIYEKVSGVKELRQWNQGREDFLLEVLS